MIKCLELQQELLEARNVVLLIKDKKPAPTGITTNGLTPRVRPTETGNKSAHPNTVSSNNYSDATESKTKSGYLPKILNHQTHNSLKSDVTSRKSELTHSEDYGSEEQSIRRTDFRINDHKI